MHLQKSAYAIVVVSVIVLFSGSIVHAVEQAVPQADRAPTGAWKYDVDILPSTSQYRVAIPQFRDALYCDSKGHLWLRIETFFVERTDLYYACFAKHHLISRDMGLTWTFTDEPWPGPRDTRSVFPDSTIVEVGSHCFVNADRWERYPLSEKERLQREGYFIHHKKNIDYRAIIYDLWMRRSTDGGKTWVAKSIHKQLPFYAYLVDRHYQRLLADGTLVAFCSIRPTAEGPRSACIVRSKDKGDTWEIIKIADGKLSPVPEGFHESFPIVYPDGRMFALIRTQLAGTAYLVRSDDGGKTWSKPEPTPIRAKHPVPTLLRDGMVVVTYQRRFARPYGVRARFTSDFGRTWSEEVVIRDNFELENGFAHPLTVELPDGTLFTAMHADKYVEDEKIQPFVFGSRWTRDYRCPSGPKLAVPPPRPKFNYNRANRSPWPEAVVAE